MAPLAVYFFGIRPYQKELKDLEGYLDKRLEKYLTNNRQQQIEKAISDLKGPNYGLRTNAVNFFQLTQHLGFSDTQIFDLISMLKDPSIDVDTKTSIAYAISNCENRFSTEFFSDAVNQYYILHIRIAAIRYFANTGIENHLEVFRKALRLAEDKSEEFRILFSYLDTKSRLILINDGEFINELNAASLAIVKEFWPAYKQSWQISEKELKESYLYKVSEESKKE